MSILPFHWQGSGLEKRKKDVFDMNKTKKCNMYCLQDTYFTEDIETIVRSILRYECVFFNITLSFNDDFEIRVLKETKDQVEIF